jgi:GntR family transcriptional regulator / MocR family aminotransferase
LVSESWAITDSGSDLLVELDPTLGRRAALERWLRQAVRSGRLQPGTRLPSSRVLAHDLRMARGTVSEAYRQLVSEGYLVARQGAGTRVAPGLTGTQAPTAAKPAAAQPRADFRPGAPDLSSFPRERWLAATRRVLAASSSEVFGYGDPRGRPELRRALAAYLGRVRGVLASPDLIVVCSGYTQGLGLLCQALHARGAAAVALEEPTLPDYARIVAGQGLEARPLAVDGAGARVDLLQDLQVDAVVLTPAHQALLGATLASTRRAAVLAWARQTGRLVVEDDYDAEFRYDRQPVGALQGLDPQRVVYAGTTSKSLAPGVRLAWLVVPPRLLEPVVEAKRLADRHTAALDQLVLAELLVSGEFDRHLRRRRLRYRHRRDQLAAAIAERVGALRLEGIAAGLHAVTLLPRRGPSEQQALAHAASRSVAVDGLSRYYWDTTASPSPQGLVIGYAKPPDHAFAAALDLLTGVLADLYRPTRQTAAGRRGSRRTP